MTLSNGDQQHVEAGCVFGAIFKMGRHVPQPLRNFGTNGFRRNVAGSRDSAWVGAGGLGLGFRFSSGLIPAPKGPRTQIIGF